MEFKVPRIACECPGCKKTIYRTMNQIENRLKVYCSIECFKKSVKARSVDLECICCKKKFKRCIGDHNRFLKIGSSGPFCSTVCSTKYLAKTIEKPHKITSAIIAEILRLHKEGKTKQDIADFYHIKVAGLNKRLRKAGVQIPWSIYDDKKPRPSKEYLSVCIVCHKEFKHKKCRSGLYCSAECFRANKHIVSVANYPRVLVPCLGCGELFETTQEKIDRGSGKYCSVQCLKNARNVTAKCDYCGKKIVRNVSHVRYKKHLYCNKQCWIQSRRIANENYVS